MLSIWEDFGGKSDGGKRRRQRVGVLAGNRVRGIILLFSAMWGRVGRIRYVVCCGVERHRATITVYKDVEIQI